MSEAFHAVDVITTKRDGHELSDDQIRWVVDAYTREAVADEQMSALAMAVLLNGMTRREIATWTAAMIASGERMDFSGLSRPTADKHSTGGVGDKITLPLAPLVAVFDVAVPQLSGRGLGHTGGTLDKLESVSGWQASLSNDAMMRQLEDVGAVICAAGSGLAPADKKLYALRDVTGTVEAIPLIASSIMSKKIAEGTGALVLDVKVGSGAFMKTHDDATELARTMVDLGTDAGVNTVALVTDMSTPLGLTAGNALEVRESVEVLAGGGPADVVELTVRLAEEMLEAAGRGGHDVAAALADGRAMDVWRRMIAAQGGDPDAPLPVAAEHHEVRAGTSGVLTELDAYAVGVAAWRLGAGRARKEHPVQAGAGVELHAKPGDEVREGQVLLTLHTDEPDRFDRAQQSLQGAVTIAPAGTAVERTAPRPRPDRLMPPAGAVAPTVVSRAPKALLHDHLDGGLRPATVVELADAAGYAGLPTTDADELGRWFRDAADSGSLERYLETFSHTVAVMQTAEQLSRVARECALDLAADGVVYAESRFAPELHIEGGLTLREVVEAVLAGFREGEQEAAAAGTPIRMRTLLTAMRHAARSREIAELAVALPRPWGRRLRHRRGGGRLPAHAAPRRLRVPAARERPLHDPRRRGVRPAEHLGGDPVVRRRPARARRADRRRHRDRRRRHPDAGAAGRLRARLPHPARDVPELEHPDRGSRLGRGAPHHPAQAAALPGHRQHGQPADERHVDEPGDAAARRRGGVDPRGPALGDHQRDEVGVPAVRRAARDHRARRQARVRRPRRRALTRGRSRGNRGRAGRSAGGERVGRQQPRPQLLLAPQPLEVTVPALGDDGRQHHLGVDAPGRRGADVRQGRAQQLGTERGAGVR